MPSPDGKGTMHAEIKIGDSNVMMADECLDAAARARRPWAVLRSRCTST